MVGENSQSMLIELELKPSACDLGLGGTILESLRFLDNGPRVLKTAGIKRSSAEGPPIFHLYDSDGLKIGQIDGQEALEFQQTLLEYCPECSLSYDEETNDNLKPNITEQLVDLAYLKKVLI
jgi:hypothetical protein